MTRPPCHNRPPRSPGYTRHGIDSATGQPIEVFISHAWSPDRCATWDGVGIGAPTDEYPSGTPYPLAHGWDCSGCVWLPEGVVLPGRKQDAPSRDIEADTLREAAVRWLFP